MKNKKITRKISQGVYVLTTSGGGCIVDAVSQVSAGDNPYIAVSVMKSNYTNELLHKNKTFSLSILPKNANGRIIETFGLNSMRDINKFAEVDLIDVDNLKVINKSLGYMICEIVDVISLDTHDLFIGKLIEADVFDESEPMTYAHYQEHKDELLQIQTEKGKTAWVCSLCGYVYYGEKVLDDFICPWCGATADLFEKKND